MSPTMPAINALVAETVLALINSTPRTPTSAEIIDAIDTAHLELGIPRQGSPLSMEEPMNPAYAHALALYRLADQEVAARHVRPIDRAWFDLGVALLKVFPELAKEKL